MSAGDVPPPVLTSTNYDSDDSSSSKSIFNRPNVPIISSPPINTQLIHTILSEQIPSITTAMHDEHTFQSTSQVRLLEERLNNQNATLYHQQSEIIDLRKTVRDLSTQIHQQSDISDLRQTLRDLSVQVNHITSVVNSPTHSPLPNSRSNSAYNCINNDYLHDHLITHSSRSPLHVPQSNPTCMSPPTQMNSSNYYDTSNHTAQNRHLQGVLNKTNAALERHDNDIHFLNKQISDLCSARTTLGKNSSHLLTPTSTSHIIKPSPDHSRTSAFVPIDSSYQAGPIIVPSNTLPPPPLMPFTMTLTNTLPNFSGKDNELPTKFITEFELRASGLFGYHDVYLIRAVQQSLSDTALTWFVQQQQEQSITTWTQFKQLFLRRFRTPDKIESLRGRLRTLWQGDHESTADYFERLKALVSEIEPATCPDYLKRKFLQKLRHDIRDKMPIGMTHSLPDLVLKATEIETNIIQQKIDDKLRAAQTADHQSATVNNLFNVSDINSSSLPSHDTETSYDNYAHNSNYNNNQNSSRNKYSLPFTNSATTSPRSSNFQNSSRFSRPNVNRNTQFNTRTTNRWCSFCSSTSHTWLHCYSNPNGPNYQPERYPNVEQRQPRQEPMLPPRYSQQQYSTREQHYQPLNQHERIPQQQSQPHPYQPLNQQQHYQHPQSSSYSPSERPFMAKNIKGSRL
jgi:hypothetical protein